jgi:hypothetical protein
MDISLDEDTASVVSVNNEFFYKHFIEQWSHSDDDSYLMLVVTRVERDHAYYDR